MFFVVVRSSGASACPAQRQLQCLVHTSSLRCWPTRSPTKKKGARSVMTRRFCATKSASFQRRQVVNGSVDGTASSLFSEHRKQLSFLENTTTAAVENAGASENSTSPPVGLVGTTISTSTPSLVTGVILDHAVNLKTVRPGDRLDIPYELTISESLPDFWFACFFDQSRIHCSTPFCRRMGLQDRVLPFSLALFLTSSMSHADAAKVQGMSMEMLFYSCIMGVSCVFVFGIQ